MINQSSLESEEQYLMGKLQNLIARKFAWNYRVHAGHHLGQTNLDPSQPRGKCMTCIYTK